MHDSLERLVSYLEDKNDFKQVRHFLESQFITEDADDANDNNLSFEQEEGVDKDEEARIEQLANYRNSPYETVQFDESQKASIEEDLHLLTRKGVYPYEYMTDIDKFKETNLPSRSSFKSTLSLENISETEYQHAQNVFHHFEMKDMLDYTNLYVTTDVLILSDVFEKFRTSCIQHYGLDPAHFYTAPGLSWQAALKMTGVKLELLTDLNQHLFIEAGIRGGVSVISHRFAKANHPDVRDYDPSLPTKHLIYLDANNLYGWAMSQPLPTGKFMWLNDEEIAILTTNIINTPDSSETGYILEVDLGERYFYLLLFWKLAAVDLKNKEK